MRAAIEALRDAAAGALNLLGERWPEPPGPTPRSWTPPVPQIGMAAALSGMAECFDDLADHARFLAQRTDLIWPLPQHQPRPTR